MIGGVTIYETNLLTETVEDWSDVRSPSRAARRQRQGHPQRIRYVERPKKQALMVGGNLFMHPDIAALLRGMVPLGRLGIVR